MMFGFVTDVRAMKRLFTAILIQNIHHAQNVISIHFILRAIALSGRQRLPQRDLVKKSKLVNFVVTRSHEGTRLLKLKNLLQAVVEAHRPEVAGEAEALVVVVQAVVGNTNGLMKHRFKKPMDLNLHFKSQ